MNVLDHVDNWRKEEGPANVWRMCCGSRCCQSVAIPSIWSTQLPSGILNSTKLLGVKHPFEIPDFSQEATAVAVEIPNNVSAKPFAGNSSEADPQSSEIVEALEDLNLALSQPSRSCCGLSRFFGEPTVSVFAALLAFPVVWFTLGR